jgi:dienelactone hydrolase
LYDDQDFGLKVGIGMARRDRTNMTKPLQLWPASSTPDRLEDFALETFSHDGVSRPVYRLPRPGKRAVVLLHEVPGITPETARLARLLFAAGYSVFLPSLFGTPGEPFGVRYASSILARLCVAGEFAAFAAQKSGPIVDWLRALCRAAHAEQGGPGVGVIGMCFTGNFAISLMADPSVLAPVASQPSLPAGRPGELHVSPEELVQLKARARAGQPLLGLRFSGDKLCPRARFERLRAELGDRFEAVEIDSSPGNPHALRRFAHSVLTLDFVDEDGHPTRAALDRVLAFLAERLDAPTPAPPA